LFLHQDFSEEGCHDLLDILEKNNRHSTDFCAEQLRDYLPPAPKGNIDSIKERHPDYLGNYGDG
jgi:hypothetical protein